MERDVKRGCCSCTHYKLTMKQEPCKSCKDWSGWEDKDHDKPIAGAAVGAGIEPAAGVRKAKKR